MGHKYRRKNQRRQRQRRGWTVTQQKGWKEAQRIADEQKAKRATYWAKPEDGEWEFRCEPASSTMLYDNLSISSRDALSKAVKQSIDRATRPRPKPMTVTGNYGHVQRHSWDPLDDGRKPKGREMLGLSA